MKKIKQEFIYIDQLKKGDYLFFSYVLGGVIKEVMKINHNEKAETFEVTLGDREKICYEKGIMVVRLKLKLCF